MILSDFGADVIKVEEPESGDYGRFMPPYGAGGTSLFFTAINRNKRSITLNLKTKEGRAIFLQLVRGAGRSRRAVLFGRSGFAPAAAGLAARPVQ